MARPSFRHVFLRLPPATALLLFSAVVGWADGHAVPLPRQTTTLEYHELNVVLFPPLPTPAPLSPADLRRRQEDNTICGYLGGNSDLPATCQAGSHCVLDIEHDVVGCCPNGGSCTTGVFTGCVDKNSGPRSEVNPYVYTCQGQDVCYLNNYAGGYHQYGCGTASDLATTVQTTAQGQSSLRLIRSSIPFTAQPITLSAPSSSRSASSSSSSSSSSVTSSTSASRTSSASTSSSSTGSSADTSTASPTASTSPSNGANSSYTGAIVGGTIGGVAFLALLIALIFFLLRRHKNQREGPGPDPTPPPVTEYTSPMRSHGAAFAPLPTWQEEEEEPQTTPQPRYVPPYSQSYNQYDDPYHQGNVTQVSAAGSPSPPPPRPTARPESSWPLTAYDPAHVVGGGPGQTPISDQFMVTHGPASQREIDDFSREVSTTMQNAQEEDTQPLTRYPPGSYAHEIRRGDRPLWQQTRRQSRNLMWM